MGSVPQKTLNWLYSVLTSEYHDINRTYTDVAQALSRNPSFSPRTDVYTYENGHSSLLVNLTGTLPVNFRGTTYMFPMSIWIPHGYPRTVPINLVTPTKNMAVRTGQYVSGEGRVYHPYLAGWREDRSNISEFLSILQEVFAREPPVISRQERTPQPVLPSRSNEAPAPPPIPPLPSELRTANVQSPPLSGSEARAPQPPPKPFAPAVQPLTIINDRTPPAPPHPGRIERQYGMPQNGYPSSGGLVNPERSDSRQRIASEYQPTSSSHETTYHQLERQRNTYSPVSPMTPPRQPIEYPSRSMQAHQGRYAVQSPPALQLPTTGPNPTNHQWNEHHPSYPQQNFPSYQNNSNSRNQPLQQQPQPKPKPKPAEDLLTSPFDNPLPVVIPNVAPPPVPPNPQKDALLSALCQTLSQQVQSSYASNLAAIPQLRAQQSAMDSALAAINQEISQLNNLQSLLSSNEAILHQAMRDADKVMEDAKHRKVPGVDEVLVVPTVVAGQLYELVADERSLEECRGVLAKALDRGRVGGDVWAKQTRSLAREEFLKKALIRKIARGMGLMEQERWE